MKSVTLQPVSADFWKVYAGKVPYEFVEEIPASGNSANASVSAARLGISSALVAHIGADHDGEKCLETLKENKVATDFVVSNEGIKTNYHYVLWYDKDRTILVKHNPFPYTFPYIGSPKWLYLSSLGENSLPFHNEIETYLENHPDTHLIFQPGTYQLNFDIESISGIYKKSKIFICNIEEAQKILKIEKRDLPTLLKAVRDLGPELVVLTDGPNGAYASFENTNIFLPVFPDQRQAYERTGAGDAYASTFSVALALGKSVEESLKWASINSASVVQSIGAQKGLLTREVIEKTLAKLQQIGLLRISRISPKE